MRRQGGRGDAPVGRCACASANASSSMTVLRASFHRDTPSGSGAHPDTFNPSMVYTQPWHGQ